MGPTAAGKTDVAVSLRERFPLDIISVDSALVYRGMNIGTAKPDAMTLRRAPHRLIDIRDPEENYSAGEFVRDAQQAIGAICAAGRVPLLVGGTMMYFRALTEGIAELPSANVEIRDAIDAEAAKLGWPALHARLRINDPIAADRINENDSQRIQRALEVFESSRRSLTDWQQASSAKAPVIDIEFIKIVLQPPARQELHDRIEKRLNWMLAHGFLGEVETLMQRPGLTRDSPAMRSVGYRQIWAHLAGEYDLAEGRYRALVATRQLAKRQITWLRSESNVFSVDPLEGRCIDTISEHLAANAGILES
jgi:tRNA dimethylallyltransferase